MDTGSLQLRVAREFSLKATVLSHGWHECAPMNWSEGGRCFQTIDCNGGHSYRISVVENGVEGRAPKLTVTVDGGEVVDGVLQGVRDRLRVTLGLDRDLSGFYELCARHSRLGAIPRIGGGRLIRSASMTENIIKALCATNVNWTQAVKMINRIAQLGPHVPHFRNLTAWPGPREILRAGERYLNEVCRLGYRTESILSFCRGVCDGRFNPESLDVMASDQAVSSDDLLSLLRSIHGIGPSSAHYLLGFLGRHDRLSIDSATVAHVAQLHTNGRRPTNKQIERIYAPYGRWKNLVYWCENWLTWATAGGILREAGLDGRQGSERRA